MEKLECSAFKNLCDARYTKKINFLRNELHNHNHRYYVEDNPILTDLEFDLMLKELEELEAENPQFLILIHQRKGLGDP